MYYYASDISPSHLQRNAFNTLLYLPHPDSSYRLHHNTSVLWKKRTPHPQPFLSPKNSSQELCVSDGVKFSAESLSYLMITFVHPIFIKFHLTQEL